MTARVTLTFSWPIDTSLNARLHWAKRKQANDVNFLDGWASARQARMTMPSGEYMLIYWFHPPDKRKRDLDNMLARMKKHQDGMFDAWGLDDSCIRRVILEWGEVEKPGRVVIEVREIT